MAIRALIGFCGAWILGISFSAAHASEQSTSGWGPPPPWEWGKNNLHLVHEDSQTGFALYRASKPDAEDLRGFCSLGITEIMVLSGTAEKREIKHAKECPTLRVVYNVEQSTSEPLDRGFLDSFDAWVAEARALGKKVAFRCECGCHRTGRLAAYYQMKHMQLPLDDALAILSAYGNWMAAYPQIYQQVIALADHIAGRPCSTRAKHCVRNAPL